VKRFAVLVMAVLTMLVAAAASTAIAAEPRSASTEWERPLPKPPERAATPAVAGDAAAGRGKAGACMACHRIERPAPFIPYLQGQPYDYLYRQMEAFRASQRKDSRTRVGNGGDMHLASSALSVADRRDLARYFSGQVPVRARFEVDAARVAAGRSRVESMQCAGCHGPGFAGAGRVGRLAGQHPEYIAGQFGAIQSGRRSHPVDRALQGLSNDDIEAMSQYIAQLP
jgi:cytochrome c553